MGQRAEKEVAAAKRDVLKLLEEVRDVRETNEQIRTEAASLTANVCECRSTETAAGAIPRNACASLLGALGQRAPRQLFSRATAERARLSGPETQTDSATG